MAQTRIRNSLFERSRSARPKAIQAVTPFVSTDEHNYSLFVNLFDYATVEMLQIISITKVPFTVIDLIVDGEFRPTLSVVNLTFWITALHLPKPMSQGSSFSAVLQASATGTLLPGSCYPKRPTSLVISTDHGNFAFTSGRVIRAMA